MLSSFKSEIYKLKKNKIIPFFGILIFLSVFIIMINSTYAVENNLLTPIEWSGRIQSIVIRFLIPIFSGIIFTLSIQNEYQDSALLNHLTTTCTRTEFIIGKLVIWLTIYMLMVIIAIIGAIINYNILYHASYLFQDIMMIVSMQMVSGFAGFLVLLPLLPVAIIQRKIFYPTILITFVFALVEFMGSTPMFQAEIFRFIPWTAASIISTYGVDYRTMLPCLISICVCAVLSIFIGAKIFKNQDL